MADVQSRPRTSPQANGTKGAARGCSMATGAARLRGRQCSVPGSVGKRWGEPLRGTARRVLTRPRAHAGYGPAAPFRGLCEVRAPPRARDDGCQPLHVAAGRWWARHAEPSGFGKPRLPEEREQRAGGASRNPGPGENKLRELRGNADVFGPTKTLSHRRTCLLKGKMKECCSK